MTTIPGPIFPNVPIASSDTVYRYYSNCRGVNYIPAMREEWKASGYLPRIPNLFLAPLYSNPGFLADAQLSATFFGANKTTQWWYYNHADNENCISLLRSIGINSLRVFTDIYVWARDKTRFWSNIRDFLRICERHKVRAQFVLWDEINIAFSGLSWTEPSNTAMTASGVEHGLLSTWQRIPYGFHRTLGTASGDYFYQNSAIPFITEFAQNASAFQSLWSFDVMNEGTTSATSALVSGSCLLISSLLSSLGIGITIGHAGGLNPLPVEFPDNNPYDNIPHVVNFASIHPYQNTRMSRNGFVDSAASSSNIIHLPTMGNEGVTPNYGMFYDIDLSAFDELHFGTMPFDGMIDCALSREPFLASQGLIYWDGTVRDKTSVDMYPRIAVKQGWLKACQLNWLTVQKQISEDGGADGGYWSGIIPEHTTYNAELYVSSSEALWTAVRNAWIYPIDPINFPTFLTTNQYSLSANSKNFAPYGGHPMSPEAPNYSLVWQRFTFSAMLSALYDWNNHFTALSTLPYSESGNDFRNKDIAVFRRNSLLASLVISMGDQLDYWSPKYQTVYSKSIIPAATQLAWSSIYHHLIRTDGSSISPLGGATTVASGEALCVTTSTCLGVGGHLVGARTDVPNWPAYDAYYDDCVVKLKDVFDIILEAAETDDYYRLTP